jgi:hypothetical protein
MFVPFDRLYDFLDQNTERDTLIYRFHPNGAKKYSDISVLRDYENLKRWKDHLASIPMLMHDQEPLNFDLYRSLDISEITYYLQKNHPDILKKWKEYGVFEQMSKISMSNNLDVFHGYQLADHWLLCHSEKNSSQLSKYETIDAIGVYWWSHAMISRDWYRYAKVDQMLQYKGLEFHKDFNVYNRAWAGSREYRLKFAEMILQNDLFTSTSITLSQQDNECHYRDYKFQNTKFQIHSDLSMFKSNESTSCASADYSQYDYIQSAIDVVLETLFDDTRVHLTEKILRPIACGKPFILVSTPGSLQYLRDYGFETFGEYINENYDSIQDPLDRLKQIIKLMKDISQLSKNKKNNLYQKLHQVASRNKKWFWSDDFARKIIDEFRGNYKKSYDICKASQHGQKWLEQRKKLCSFSDEYRKWLCSDNDSRSRQDIVKTLMKIKKTSI